jgi:hypothetical protein
MTGSEVLRTVAEHEKNQRERNGKKMDSNSHGENLWSGGKGGGEKVKKRGMGFNEM